MGCTRTWCTYISCKVSSIIWKIFVNSRFLVEKIKIEFLRHHLSPTWAKNFLNYHKLFLNWVTIFTLNDMCAVHRRMSLLLWNTLIHWWYPLVNEVPTRHHTSCWSAFPEIALSTSQGCDLMCGGSPRLAETAGHLDKSLCVVRVMSRTSSALPLNVLYSPFEPSHFRLQNNTDRLCHVWKWLPMPCTLLSVTVSVRSPPEVLCPSKHYFCYWHVLTAESALHQKTKHDPKSPDCLRLCHKTIHTL